MQVWELVKKLKELPPGSELLTVVADSGKLTTGSLMGVAESVILDSTVLIVSVYTKTIG